jgi:hypothetical protein
MRRSPQLLVVSTLVILIASSVLAEFVPGRVYVAYGRREPCGPAPRILEFDPSTGSSREFYVGSNECFRGIGGLTFTPDGQGLRASDGYFNRILEIDGDASSRVVLDAGDGINLPGSSRGLEFGSAGDFFVVNYGSRQILRFPAGGASGEVFASVPDLGPIAAGPFGSLYYGNDLDREITRFSSEGEGTPFDLLPSGHAVESISTNSAGDLFVLSTGGVYRYLAGDPTSRTLLVPSLSGQNGTIALSPDGTQLYVVRSFYLHTVDARSGALIDRDTLPFINDLAPWAGIAVYVPEPTTGVQLTLALIALLIRKRGR